jgi:hypothetical protein
LLRLNEKPRSATANSPLCKTYRHLMMNSKQEPGPKWSGFSY